MSILWRIATTLLGTIAAALTPTTPAISLVALHPTTDTDTDSTDGEPPHATARGPPTRQPASGPVPTSPPGQATPTSSADRPQGELLSATKENY